MEEATEEEETSHGRNEISDEGLIRSISSRFPSSWFSGVFRVHADEQARTRVEGAGKSRRREEKLRDTRERAARIRETNVKIRVFARRDSLYASRSVLTRADARRAVPRDETGMGILSRARKIGKSCAVRRAL